MGFVPQDISNCSNKHIWEFLRYYLSTERSPGYAVLIDGPWGAGKSHLVSEILKDHFRGWKDDYAVISLFGLSELADVENAVFAAIYPMLKSPGANIAGGLLKSVLSHFDASPDLRLEKILSNRKARVYVFDDLERCEVDVTKVLGYVNSFVEAGARVIIVGDQERLHVTQSDDNRKRFLSEREKLIGRVLKVEPSFADAFESFARSLESSKAAEFMMTQRELLREIFEQSKSSNLRLLKLSMLEFERVLLALEERHFQNEPAMLAAMKLFFAISIEVKCGNITEDDLHSRDSGIAAAMRRHLGKSSEKERDAINLVETRYSSVDIRDDLISNDFLTEVLFRGVVDASKIRLCLDRSRFFAVATEQPPWLRLVHIFDLTDDEFEPLFSQMEESFHKREVVVVGEMLHVFSHRLFFAQLGLISKDVDAVADECTAYVDALYDKGGFDNATIGDEISYSGYAGYAFSERDSPAFKRIVNHLRLIIGNARIAQLPVKAKILLEEMINSEDLFARRITLTNSKDNVYWDVPLLSTIEPLRFVEELLKKSPTGQRTVLDALGDRYERQQLREGQLLDEIPWIREVRGHLLEATEQLPRLARERLKLLVKWRLESVVES